MSEPTLDGRYPDGIGTVDRFEFRTTPRDEAYLAALAADLDTTRAAVVRAGLRRLAHDRDLTVEAPTPEDDLRADGGVPVPDARLTFDIYEREGHVRVTEPQSDVEGVGPTLHDALIDLARTHAARSESEPSTGAEEVADD